jgi:drug/metabolite transporter (DMT)-like permease
MPESHSPRPAWHLGLLCALAVLAIWTSFILIARVSAARTLSPFDIAFVRFVFAGAVGLVLWPRFGATLKRELTPPQGGTPWPRLALLTALAGVGYCSLAYSGFFYAPVAHASVLLPGSLPMWTALWAAWLLRDRITGPRALGLGLMVAGDLLVGGASLWEGLRGGQSWRGDVLFMGASACWGLYTVLCRHWRLSAMTATLAVALGCLVSAVPFYAVGVASGLVPSQLSRAGWGEILFQGLYQGGFSMWLAGLAFTQVVVTFGPIRTTLLTSTVPVLAALLAVPLLGEALSAYALVGLVCVTLGLLLGLYALRQQAAAPLPSAVRSA